MDRAGGVQRVTELTRLTVTLVDGTGRVRVAAGDMAYEGHLADPPRTLARGQRLSMTLDPVQPSPFDSGVEVVGKVLSIEGIDGGLPNTPIFAGLRFSFEVARMTRTAGVPAQDDVADDTIIFPPMTDGRIESKVFRRAPVIATLSDVGLSSSSSGEGEVVLQPSDIGGLGEFADTVLVPPPLMTHPGASAEGPDLQSADLISTEMGIPDREPTGVIGTLRQVSLAEVVQGLELGRKTARVEVRPGGDRPRGRVWLKDGQVLHAEVGELHGEHAFYALARVESGTYRVRFGREPSERSIHRPTAFLILEAMRRLDEELKLGGVLPPSTEGQPAVSQEGGPVLAEEPAVAAPVASAAEAASASEAVTVESSAHQAPPSSTGRSATGAASGDGPRADVPRLPTAVRQGVVGALEKMFEAAGEDDEHIIPVDEELEELVIEERPVPAPGGAAVPAPELALPQVTAPTQPLPVVPGARGHRAVPAKVDGLSAEADAPPPRFGKKMRTEKDRRPNVFGGFFEEASEESSPRRSAPDLPGVDEEDDDSTGSFSSLKSALTFLSHSEEAFVTSESSAERSAPGC